MKKIPDLKIYSILSQAECKVGLYVESIDTEEVFEVNPNTVFPSASVIKVPMLALLMKDAQEGRVDPVSYTHLDVYKRQYLNSCL